MMQVDRTPGWHHRRGLMMGMRRFFIDRRGVGGVEFALIAPLLLALYITSLEITIGLNVSKRTTRSAGTIADLVTREASVSKEILVTMKDVAGSLFAPYAPRNLRIKLTGVAIDAAGKPTVQWSWNETNGRPYTVGDAVDVPNDMRSPNSFLVRSEIAIDHSLLMFMPNLLPPEVNNITIKREYFYRQRLGASVSCSNC